VLRLAVSSRVISLLAKTVIFFDTIIFKHVAMAKRDVERVFSSDSHTGSSFKLRSLLALLIHISVIFLITF